MDVLDVLLENKEKHTAYHEAGHAVAAVVLKGKVYGVHIESADGVAGQVHSEVSGDEANIIKILGSLVGEEILAEKLGYAITPMDWFASGGIKDALQINEILSSIYAEKNPGDIVDYLYESWSQDEWGRYYEKTHELLDPYEDAITQVASDLLQSRRLDGSRVHAVVTSFTNSVP